MGEYLQLRTRGTICRIQLLYLYFIYHINYIFLKLKMLNCFSELNEYRDELMYLQGTELGR